MRDVQRLHRKTNIAQTNLQLTHKTRVYHSRLYPSIHPLSGLDLFDSMNGVTPRVHGEIGDVSEVGDLCDLIVLRARLFLIPATDSDSSGGWATSANFVQRIGEYTKHIL